MQQRATQAISVMPSQSRESNCIRDHSIEIASHNPVSHTPKFLKRKWRVPLRLPGQSKNGEVNAENAIQTSLNCMGYGFFLSYKYLSRFEPLPHHQTQYSLFRPFRVSFYRRARHYPAHTGSCTFGYNRIHSSLSDSMKVWLKICVYPTQWNRGAIPRTPQSCSLCSQQPTTTHKLYFCTSTAERGTS